MNKTLLQCQAEEPKIHVNQMQVVVVEVELKYSLGKKHRIVGSLMASREFQLHSTIPTIHMRPGIHKFKIIQVKRHQLLFLNLEALTIQSLNFKLATP
jgi:hypothetical protein